MSDSSIDSKRQLAANNEVVARQAKNQIGQSTANQPNVDILDEAEMAKRTKHNKKWRRRLNLIFCCLGYKKNKDSIADVSTLVADFYADLDVSTTDLVAGFVLLSKYQAAQRKWIVKSEESNVEQYLSSVPITSKTKFLDISTAEDSHLINDLIYYMNYSLAIFGWLYQMVENPISLCCVCPYLKFPGCRGGSKRVKRVPTNDKDEDETRNLAKEDDDNNSNKNVAAVETRLAPTDSENNNNNKETNTKQVDEPIQIAPGNIRQKKLPRPVSLFSDDFDQPIIHGDNCCGCNVASFESRLAQHNYEFIYVSYKVNVNVVPFLVAADHSKRAIVVALRGSMGLSDMLTDMNGQHEKLPIDDCPDDWLSHKGMAIAADNIKQTLIQESILDRAFNCRPDLGSKDYNLILTGHSLGAGVSAILGILLRTQYPNLKAYLYSPPGGVVSLPLVEYTKQFAVGILLGNDCVARLGLAQLERLRYYVLLSLKSSPNSASKVVAKALFPTCCLGGNKVAYDPEQSLNVLHGTEGRSFDFNGTKIPFQVTPELLYVPGRLLHIVKNHTFKSKARRLFKEPIYQAVWNENTNYDRILVSEGMFYDHLPHVLMHAMKMLTSKTLPGRKEFKSLTTAITNQQPIDVQPKPNNGIIPLEQTSELKENPIKNIEPIRLEQVMDLNNNNEESSIHDIGDMKKVDVDENNNGEENMVDDRRIYSELRKKNHFTKADKSEIKSKHNQYSRDEVQLNVNNLDSNGMGS